MRTLLKSLLQTGCEYCAGLSILSKISGLVVSKRSVYTVNHTKIATVHVEYKPHYHVAYSIKALGYCTDLVDVAHTQKLLLFRSAIIQFQN